MTFFKPFGVSAGLLCVAVLAISGTVLTPLPVSAAKLTGNDQPAEFPPSSFTGRQYVDSQGCVFVRAGFDGAVTWVPRVSRKRQKLCGFAPSNTRGTAASTAPVVADAPRVVAPVVTAPKVAAVAPTRRVVKAAPAPTKVAPPVQARPVVTTAARTSCQGASRVSAQYINSGARCGPQAADPTGGQRRQQSGPAKQAAAQQVLTAPAVAPVRTPKGYRNAWDDGRLNPDRGKQMLSGALQTALIWTQTVPRRLIDQKSGQDVSAEYNYLVYPYTDYAKQKRDLRSGTHVVVRKANGQRFVVLKSDLKTNASGQTVLKTPRLSTKAVAPHRPAPTPQAQGGRYVQVGTFGVASNAQRTVARLQGAGLPVRLGHVKRGGKTLQVVMAGPFANGAQANGALSSVRRAGFSDAFLR